MTDPDLIRFVDAQDQIYEQVVDELSSGRKRSHWMWFIFPQLAGLGHSTMAQRYAIQDLDQARRYLADAVLGERIRADVRLMLRHKSRSALEILGSPDDLKFRSCLTFFGWRPPITLTASYSRKHWISFTAVSRTLARSNYFDAKNSQFLHADEKAHIKKMSLNSEQKATSR